MRREFSEKEFEFVFNAEFVRKYKNAFGTFFIPSQRLESLYGFDIEFRMRMFNAQYSLFLQHKVSYFISTRAPRNYNIFNYYNGPYYYFYLRKITISNQHNLLYNLRQSGEDVRYCAPLFYQRSVLFMNFANELIANTSVFADPLSIGLTADNNLHKISYDQTGNRMAYHSTLKELEPPCRFNSLFEKLTAKKIDNEYVENLLLKLEKGLNEPILSRLPNTYLELPTPSKCAYLLQKYYNLQWILFVNTRGK